MTSGDVRSEFGPAGLGNQIKARAPMPNLLGLTYVAASAHVEAIPVRLDFFILGQVFRDFIYLLFLL